MKKTLFPLVVFLLCAPPLLAEEPAGSTAAALAPSAQAGEKPGEKIPSEDSVLKNFHKVGIGRYGGKLFRGASPVRELAKSSAAPLDDPKIMKAAGQIMAHIKALGINTIISLEDPSDTGKGGKKSFSFALEKAAARSAGITLLSHPMNNADLKDMSPEPVLAWLKGVEKDINAAVKKGGVLVHCAAGHDRTGLAA
ncbi:MAG: tyrosine-protein phosphatase, partial [Elusimicrobia bacterium]|nr:tyrosine-protein phosphatase [Elusimicrobiota bacterium]